MGYFNKILNNCNEVSLLALKSKEEKITLKEKFEMRFHILFCHCCQNFIKQSGKIDESLSAFFSSKEALVKASDDFKSKMKEKLK